MKLRPLLLILAALLLQQPSSEAARWWRHIEFLASDALEGRNVGTPGFEKAAAYVEAQFKDIGLRPGGTSGYRQPVKLESRLLVTGDSQLTLIRHGQEQRLALPADASVSSRGELNGSIDAPMTFVGYGLSIPEAGWDDLAGVDLRGRIAVYVNAPAPVDIPDSVRSHVTSIGERWAVLKKAGAIGIATIAPPRPTAPPSAPSSPSPGSAGITPPANPPAPTAAPPTIVLADHEVHEFTGLVLSMSLTRSGAEKLFAGSGHTFDEIAPLVTAKKALPQFALPGTLRARATIRRETIDSDNVIGIHEGSDPQLKNEYVVMSAHLDHVGIGRSVAGDNIYNGAMDDASGVASVIEIARLLKSSGVKTKRSILFIAQTAEEKGLLGSRYFAARPTVPLEAIVADINLDMFLPLYPLKVIEVQGLAESTLGDSVRTAAGELGVSVQTDREPDQNRFIRSDQYSFIKRGIPSLAFKFGYEFGSAEEKIRRDWVRDVYHKPNDDLKQPVNLEAAATFNRVILSLLERVANDPARPRWNDASFFKRFAK